ncbi:MAG: HD domain-containing protein [Vicinamibacteria bacterium]|nr:HD domain-containing protein [Vicinamibacteria bacterium]
MALHVGEWTSGELDAALQPGTGATLLSFGADWCTSCRRLRPELDALLGRVAGRVRVGVIDADRCPGALSRFGVRVLPAQLLFRDGQPIARRSGFAHRDELETWMEHSLSATTAAAGATAAVAEARPGRPAAGTPEAVVVALRGLLATAHVVEARDPYTGGHLWRVSQLAWLLATEAGLPPMLVARATIGGFLHDLGKVGVPDAVLKKPARLTDDEFAIMRTHPEIGARLLGELPLGRIALPAVRSHHERLDGRGYPAGLAGSAIPIDARIVGIADAFDAMTSARPYRRGRPLDAALDEIRRERGRQFDPELALAFLALGGRGALDHVVGHAEPGIPLLECPSCGPIVVRSAADGPGNVICCRSCGSELRLEASGVGLTVCPTGRKGTVLDRTPAAVPGGFDALLHDLTPLLG